MGVTPTPGILFVHVCASSFLTLTHQPDTVPWVKGVGTVGAVGATAPPIFCQWVQVMYYAPPIFGDKSPFIFCVYTHKSVI